jgi:hypothetical protein
MRTSKATISMLQKAYDESYLTCSTAVFYESQVRHHLLSQSIALLLLRTIRLLNRNNDSGR